MSSCESSDGQSGNVSKRQSGHSVFSGEDLALIKGGRWLPELSHFVPINDPHDIDTNLDHARDDGEKIDLLLITALNPHADTLGCLGEFIQSKDLTILAATLRAFASIGEMLKDSSLDEDYRHHLERLRWVLTANLDLADEDNPSVQLFKRLCQEAESGQSDLIRWAAAYALQQLDYPAGLRRQLLHKPPAEIGEDIVPNFAARLSGRENPVGEREYLKFWVYGGAEGLFSSGSGTYYLDVLQEVLNKLGMRGIRLALQWGNRDCKLEAIDYAGEIFGNSRYKAEATRQSLANRLLPFLGSTDIELRNLVAEKLNDKGNQYQVSDKLLKESDRIRAAVMDADWQRVVKLGDPAVPLLCEVVEGSLRLRNGANNIDFQIMAVETIDKILIETSRKIATLSPYLQHDDDKLRMRVAHLLKQFQGDLDTASYAILEALFFTLELLHESSIDSLDRSSVENCVAKIGSYERLVQEVFSKAISACRSSSVKTKDFLAQQQKHWLDRIKAYLKELEIQKIHLEVTDKEEQDSSYLMKIREIDKLISYFNRIKSLNNFYAACVIVLCPFVYYYFTASIFIVSGWIFQIVMLICMAIILSIYNKLLTHKRATLNTQRSHLTAVLTSLREIELDRQKELDSFRDGLMESQYN